MTGWGSTILGAVLLMLGLGFGWWRWIQPYRDALPPVRIAVKWLIVLTLMGAFFGQFGWWLDDDDSFAWQLPPLASRMLGAAATSFAVATVVVLERATPRREHLVLVLLAVYLWPLVVAIFAFHLDRFEADDALTYSFFLIAGTMSAATAALLLLTRSPDGGTGAVETPDPIQRSWLLLVALVTGLWGLALFVTDDGPWGAIWAWPGDLLTSRLIGVMLLTIAAGSLYAARYRSTATAVLAMTATYGVGLAVASLWQAVDDRPVKPAYVAVFLVIAAGSLVLARRSQARAPADTHVQ
jgi:hypothetical protein